VSSGGGDITDSVTISISGEHTRVRKKKLKVSACLKSPQCVCGKLILK